LTTAELAARPDFTLGLAAISPSTRTIAGPGGAADVEPRVMQVLVVLADAAGQVVTRGTLFDRCWGGVYVGDDSLNRAIAAVRKLAAEIGGGSFEVETIPRTGYRLTGADATPLSQASNGVPVQPRGWSRRELAGGALGVAALGATGGWTGWRSLNQRRFDALIAEASGFMRDNGQLDPERARQALDQAVQLRPDSARAWGLLALVLSYLAAGSPPKDLPAATARSEKAAQAALALDPREPNALLAMFEVQGTTLDWWTRDRRLRQIIAIDPTNVWAISELFGLLQAAGYSRESWDWNARAIAIEPLSEDLLTKRALKLWIFGHVAESDKVIDQLRVLYPTSPWTWWVRFALYALTGRAPAAQAMLGADPTMLDKVDAALWRPALVALIDPSAENVAKALEACAAGARISGDLAGEGVLIMGALGQVDAAFDAANGFLLSRGSIVRRGPTQTAQNDAAARINTQWLFTPSCAVLYSDPRFLSLCEGIGLTEYWQRRGVKPDFLRLR
jgi:DNA-binding winged helix-turn-helix (wHTH) protein